MRWRQRSTGAGRAAREALLVGVLLLGGSLTGCLPLGPAGPNGAPGQGAAPASEAGRAPAQDSTAQGGAPGAQTAAPALAPGTSGSSGSSGSASASAAASDLQRAQARLLDGNYQRAMEDSERLQREHPGTLEAAEAALLAGEAAVADEDYGAAEGALRRFLLVHPQHPRRPAALLLLGRALEGRKDGAAAISAYQQYVDGVPPADGSAAVADVALLRASGLALAEGRVEEGWADLSRAAAVVEGSGSAAGKARVYETLAQRYLEAGNRGQAAGALQVAMEASVGARRPPRATAEVAWKLVGAHQGAGRRDLADALRRRIINDWPRTYVAQQAMTDLGPSTVPASMRGLIAFSNGRWAQAAEAYAMYLGAGAPEGNAEEARYQRAVALTRLGAEGALEALDDVATRHAQSPRAADALWEAGSLLLRRGDHPAALNRFERLAVGYPAAPRRGQALYWLGKLLPDLGSAPAGQRYMEAAGAAGYEDYYTFRARTSLRRAVPAPRPLEGQGPISAGERAAWSQWLAARGHPLEAQAARQAQVEADPRYKRGMALLEAGWRREAEEELRELLEVLGNDPTAVEHVAFQVRQRGFYPYSITLGQRLQETVYATGETSLLGAPRVVQKLLYPLAYFDLVAPAARQYGVDPLLLLGMMKQESAFEPRAQSSANARGLTQFIPDTARAVAAELQWPNWTWEDMNRPYVSVPFGAHYLSGLIRTFRGNYHFALAGYNGGPGNVLRWAKGDWSRDLDLFVEEIGFVETRTYVKIVSGNFELYKAIYYR
jgi:soluble lytic murein transglycosylase-like protein